MKAKVIFLLDIDNTLFDNDPFISDLRDHLQRELGSIHAQRYWTIFGEMRETLGYVDYLGALQRLRADIEPGSGNEQRLLLMSSFFVDYPFANRLYPRALEVIRHLDRCGPTVILSDGDVVLQPRKVQRSGLWDAVEGRVLIYVHKEQMLDAVQRHYPAHHYVMVDDKLRVLAAMKAVWQERLTTIFPRQGHYALDSTLTASQPAADITIGQIGELTGFDPRSLIRQHANEATP